MIKNVLVTTHDSLFPVFGGGALRTLKTSLEFVEMGFNVTIVAPAQNPSCIDGVRAYWIKPPGKNRSQMLSTLKFNIRLFARFVFLMNRTDLVFVHNVPAAFFVPILKLFFGFRFVLDVTDIHSEYYAAEGKNIIRGIISPFLLMLEYGVIKKADLIIAVTYAMKKRLIEKGVSPGKISVIYDGASCEEYHSEKIEGALKSVIHLGTTDRQHGTEILIKAIPHIVKDYGSARFYFVGGGRELDNIKGLAKRLGVFKYCVFTGYLPHETARKLLAKASVGIIPRPLTLPNRVVTTLKLYEYWASGTAVVSSPLDGIREIAKEGENIVFFRQDDPEDLAFKIKLLFEDRAYTRRLAVEGRRRAADFDWKHIASQIACKSAGNSSIAEAEDSVRKQ